MVFGLGGHNITLGGPAWVGLCVCVRVFLSLVSQWKKPRRWCLPALSTHPLLPALRSLDTIWAMLVWAVTIPLCTNQHQYIFHVTRHFAGICTHCLPRGFDAGCLVSVLRSIGAAVFIQVATVYWQSSPQDFWGGFEWEQE